MSRVYNFSAGPAVLPEEVLKEAADEMLDYQGSGQSVMEMSHRSKVYDNIIKEAEKDLRDLLNIPDNYKVISLQDSGLRKHLQKLRYMERLLSLLHQQTRHFHIFQTAQILIFQRILIMYISVRTTQFTEQSIRHYLTLRVIFLYQMFHHASYQNLWM